MDRLSLPFDVQIFKKHLDSPHGRPWNLLSFHVNMPIFPPSLCVCFHALEHLGLLALLLRINLSRRTQPAHHEDFTAYLIRRRLCVFLLSLARLFIHLIVLTNHALSTPIHSRPTIDKRKRRGRRHEQIYILRFRCQPSVSRYPLLIAMRKSDIISDIPPLASRDIIC